MTARRSAPSDVREEVEIRDGGPGRCRGDLAAPVRELPPDLRPSGLLPSALGERASRDGRASLHRCRPRRPGHRPPRASCPSTARPRRRPESPSSTRLSRPRDLQPRLRSHDRASRGRRARRRLGTSGHRSPVQPARRGLPRLPGHSALLGSVPATMAMAGAWRPAAGNGVRRRSHVPHPAALGSCGVPAVTLRGSSPCHVRERRPRAGRARGDPPEPARRSRPGRIRVALDGLITMRARDP